MRAARFAAFGGPEVLAIEDIPVPDPAPGGDAARIPDAGGGLLAGQATSPSGNRGQTEPASHPNHPWATPT
jgi:hypothetical protein